MWVRPAFLVACVLAGCAGSDETARDRRKGHHKRKKAGREESDARPEAGAGLAQTKSRLVRQVQSATAFCAAAKRRRTRRSYGDSASGVRLQPFVVLSRQHSGSTWLGLVLDGRPCVVCGNEKFHEARPPYVFGDAEARRQAMLKALETVGLRPRGGDGDALDAFYADLERRPQKFTPWVAKTNATLGRGAGAFGFKWMFTQGVFDDLRGWFFDVALDYGVKVVWLRRRNLFKQYLSSRLTYADDAQDGTVELDAPALLEMLRDHEAEDAAVSALLDCLAARGVDARRFDYEDLLADGGRFADLEDFLLADVVHRHGACHSADAGPTKDRPKNHTRHPADYVRNWPAVAAALRGTPWARMPDEP